MRATLTLTPSAVNKIKLLKEKPELIGLKVGVHTRACNGLSYTLEYWKTKGDSDEVVQDGVSMFTETKIQLALLGTEMDYVKDKLASELSLITQTSKELVAVERALIFETSGLLWL
ncbi:Iron-sulfur cluster assembly 1-like protein, mitochondrial [Heterocephalus glaber]|uniref:Iron-sulfur cluster assembly 1 homolog, mitochondrial n=1 Tax=Heterocephalus glaber TaxID=10181 RepID=G5AXM2_HETGA|nr:Iron-sulfur cluster assembly 1-like protein, mitochondrial [Heterocephalus glaber]